MKTIYVAKIDCMYLWSTASDTIEECRVKALTLISTDKKRHSTISKLQVENIESFLLL